MKSSEKVCYIVFSDLRNALRVNVSLSFLKSNVGSGTLGIFTLSPLQHSPDASDDHIMII